MGKSAKALADEVTALLADQSLDDRMLLLRLELLAKEQAFGGLTPLWGPALHERNKIRFRSFILNHFSEWWVNDKGRWHATKWRGEHQAVLQAWLEQADREDDVALYRRLNAWRLRKGWRVDERRWIAELVRRFDEAGTAAKRAIVLDKYETWLRIRQGEARKLYRIDPTTSRKFILAHLPGRGWGKEGKLWSNLHGDALARGDEELAFELYRRQIPVARWAEDILLLADRFPEPDKLDAELERRHPKGWGLDLGKPLYQLVRKRGRDVVPYAIRHARNVYSHWVRGSFEKLLDHARAKEWLDLWTTLVRTCANHKEFNKEVRRVLNDTELSPDDKRARLGMLAGVSREWNFGGFGVATVHSLDDEVALQLYDRFPALVRGPYKPHVAPTWAADYVGLLERLIEEGEEALIDRIASRYATQAWIGKDKHPRTEAIAKLSRYYEALRNDPPEFSRRAAAVLTLVPTYSIWNYQQLIRNNRLARLLFSRSARDYLASPSAVRDLVEASDIHVQALAYRVLALDDDRARALARESLPILQGTLLRPLHRKTRLPAFDALLNAASTEDDARRVLARCRDALELPDKRYPKEQLIGLIGHILHRHPSLRGATEQPRVFRERVEAAP